MATYGADFYKRSKYGGSVVVDYGVDPFEAVPVDFDQASLTWSAPGGAWTKFRLVRNRAGYPVVESDGVSLLEVASGSQVPVAFQDTNIVGGWYYYAIFLYNPTRSAWERAAITDVLIPYDYNSSTRLWDSIPEYYRTIRDNAAGYSRSLYQINPAIYMSGDDTAPNEQLAKFLEVIGWGLDQIRSGVDGMLNGYDTKTAHISRLAALADQFGGSLETAVPAQNNRNLVRNLGLLYRKRGTVEGLEELLRLATGWDVDVSIGPNLLISRDQANAYSPTVPYWDPGVRYAVGDNVRNGTNGYYFQALQVNFGASMAPPTSNTSNAYWSVTPFTEAVLDRTTARSDTGDISTWQLKSDAAQLTGKTYVALGVSDPVTSEMGNALAFYNDQAGAGDFTLKSVPRLATALTTHDRELAIKSGVPVPQIFDVLTIKFINNGIDPDFVPYVGELVTAENSNKTPYLVYQENSKQQGNFEFLPVGIDKRLWLTYSFYAHGPFNGTAGTGGVPVAPWLLFMDENGNVISEVNGLGLTNTSLVQYDAFGVGGGPVSAATTRTLPIGGKQMSTQGKWNLVNSALLEDPAITPNVVGTVLSPMSGAPAIPADTNLGLTFAEQGTREMGIMFRSDPSITSTNYWAATNTRLFKVVAGALTTVVTWSTPFAAGDRMRVTANGSVITVYKNGVQVGTTTDAFNSTLTNHGIIAV